MAERTAFLERIRTEVAKGRGLFEASTAPRPAHPADAAEAIKRQMAERWPEALERFKNEFERIAGVFHRVAGWADVPNVIVDVARQKSATRVVTWEPSMLGFDPHPRLQAEGLSLAVAAASDIDESVRLHHRDESAKAQIGVTGADWVLAETWTLILISGLGRPRATSILPDTHTTGSVMSYAVETLE